MRFLPSGYAAGSPGERFLVAILFFGGEFALGMSIEIRAVAAQSEHEQQLGIHAW